MFTITGKELWQYDTDRAVEITLEEGQTVNEVHFATGKQTAYRVTLEDGQTEVDIPPEVLQSGNPLIIFAWVGTETGRTLIKETFSVNLRNKPQDYIYTPSLLAKAYDFNSLEEIESLEDEDEFLVKHEGLKKVTAETLVEKVSSSAINEHDSSESAHSSLFGNVVHKSGNEDILGNKKFYGYISVEEIRSRSAGEDLTLNSGGDVYIHVRDSDVFGVVINDLVPPTNDSDAATKKYVDDKIQPLSGATYPIADGTYHLRLTIVDGVKTFSWVEE